MTSAVVDSCKTIGRCQYSQQPRFEPAFQRVAIKAVVPRRRQPESSAEVNRAKCISDLQANCKKTTRCQHHRFSLLKHSIQPSSSPTPSLSQIVTETNASVRFGSFEPLLGSVETVNLENIHWVIASGESGPGERPVEAEWVRELRDQCETQRVAFYFKQWGGRTPKAGGNTLDGRQWMEYPENRSGRQRLCRLRVSSLSPLQRGATKC